MEHEAGERTLVPIKERRRLAPQNPVQRRKALLPVEEQLHGPRGKLLAAAMGRRLRSGDPDEQAPHRVAAVERGEERPHLIPVPDEPALELRQGQRADINARKNV